MREEIDDIDLEPKRWPPPTTQRFGPGGWRIVIDRFVPDDRPEEERDGTG